MENKIKVEYYTDPLCSWSFAAEENIRKFHQEFKDLMDFKVMTLPRMDRLASEPDPEQKILSPDFLKNEWKRVSLVTNTPIDTGLWDENPPHSSWPGCRAVKAAQRQGDDQANTFLHNFRIAIFRHKKNPGSLEVMKEIAGQSGLDVERFHNDMTANAAELEDEVSLDAQEAAAKCVDTTPTLLFESPNGDKVMISGPRDYNLMRQAMITLMQELKVETDWEAAAFPTRY